MKEEFKAPIAWIARFKKLANYNGKAFIKAYRTSKWQVKVELLKSEMCIIAAFTVNAKTGKVLRTV
jgi:hypothetical protein